MTQTTEENTDKAKPGFPGTIGVLAILVYIGNIYWAFIYGRIVFGAMSLDDSFAYSFADGYYLPSENIIAGLLLLSLCVFSCVGAFEMSKGKKSGFRIYLIANGLWIGFCFWSGTAEYIAFATGSIIFILAFATQIRHLE